VDRETRKKFKKMFKGEVEDSIAKLKTHSARVSQYEHIGELNVEERDLFRFQLRVYPQRLL